MGVIKQIKFTQKVLKKFLLILFCSCTLLGVALLVFYQQQINNNTIILNAEERHAVNLQRKVMIIQLATVVSDLLFLSEQGAVKSLLTVNDPDTRDLLNSDFRSFSKFKKHYDQIRLLDNNGQEVIRVNHNNGNPKSVLGDKLQSKQKRYYFKDTHTLNKGEVYISPFDLNIEQGKVEKPLKPMIRFGTPVFDQSGRKLGIALLNYQGEKILELIRDIGSESYGKFMLINPQGYWLQHPNHEKEWGFMFAERAGENFAQQCPKAWQQIQTKPSGYIQTTRGGYTFATIRPLDSQFISSTGAANAFDPSIEKTSSSDYYWKLVSFVATNTLNAHATSQRKNFFLLATALSVIALVTSWLLAVAITKREHYRQRMFSMAHFDALTGLPNRTLLYDRLNQSLLLAKRKKSSGALLYMDLDRFKQVNDSLGHAAGDELLVAVSKRLTTCCRESDTVARIGGDEFTIVINDINDTNGCKVIAEKIIDELSRPFTLQQGEVQIGASIGIAIFPECGETADILLKRADKAMYKVKNNDKNSYEFAD